MLTALRIQNFKSWRDTGLLRLAPLTVIFGANSTGKSSIGHLLLALKQTALSADRRRALNLGDATTPIDLGTFADCIYGHDLSQTLSFHVGWRLPRGRMEVRDSVAGTRYNGDSLALDSSLTADRRTQQPRVTAVKYGLLSGGEVSLDVGILRNEASRLDLKSERFHLVRATGRPWPLEEPEKFYRFSERSIARFQNAGFLTDFALATEAMLRSITYLGPLREPPQRIYSWSGDTPEDVGQKGQFAIPAILAATSEGRKLNRRRGRGRGTEQRLINFAEFIATWMKDIGVIDEFVVEPVAVGRKEYEVLIKTHPKAPEVKITDVGFGVSQVLPALVQAFYCPPNSTVWMEQPEIHLHPQVQDELADVFISAIQAGENGEARNTQLIIESHSEHFLNRLQRRISEETIAADDVAIYFAKRTANGTELEPLRLNRYGDIENWPENFFGDEMADLTARTVAAASRRQRERKK
jgi:predicted ATPase